ncbi:MAG: DUF1559 domain-containing protein [Pirellulaceae bacterium]
MNKTRRARRGFTIAELSVVLAITGLLLALAVPALQSARDAARRSACAQNLVRLQASLHRHEAAHGVFPAGVRHDSGPIVEQESGFHPSWTVDILPYVDQQATYNRVDRGASDYSDDDYTEDNVSLRQTPIAVLRCSLASAAAPRSSYAGVHHDQESPINDDNHGLLFLNSRIGYDDIPDGLAHTLLLGEKRGGPNDLGWMSGTRATLRNTGARINRTERDAAPPLGFRTTNLLYDDFDSARDASRQDEPSRPAPHVVGEFVGGFGSRHVGGAFFAYADGRVQFLADGADLQLLRALAHRADGGPENNALVVQPERKPTNF